MFGWKNALRTTHCVAVEYEYRRFIFSSHSNDTYVCFHWRKKKIAMRMQPKITQKSDYLDHENQTNQSPFLTQHFFVEMIRLILSQMQQTV